MTEETPQRQGRPKGGKKKSQREPLTVRLIIIPDESVADAYDGIYADMLARRRARLAAAQASPAEEEV
jgi:hypothetical protein